MADWVTISSLATAGGTLVLAVATFSSVRSANRTAQAAERSLLIGMRPVLIPSREDDPSEHARFADGYRMEIPGHGARVELDKGRVYLGIGLRNAGSGLAVIHGWYARPYDREISEATELEAFVRQRLDLYVPAGGGGYWQGALRDDSHEQHGALSKAVRSREEIVVDLLYSDHEGGQRTIARFALIASQGDGSRMANVLRYWNLDGHNPRDRES